MQPVDYSPETVSITFVRDNGIFYASAYPELERILDNFNFTGNYIVVMLHPAYGTIHFKLAYNEDWTAIDSKFEIDEESIRMIGDAIENKSE